ncbi:MAG: hypothetical protein QM729_21450 [Solirubrobacterales bacterium]
MNKFLLGLAVLAATVVLAGDQQLGRFTLSGTAACFNAGPKRKTAIQCTSDAYVNLSPDGVSDLPSSTNGVLVSSGKLYDAPTVANTGYVCAVQVSAGGTCTVFVNRGPTE